VLVIHLNRKNVPSIQLFTVASLDRESSDLVLQKAKGIGDVEIAEPSHLNCMQVNNMRLEGRFHQ